MSAAILPLVRSRWPCLAAVALFAVACSGDGRSLGRSDEPGVSGEGTTSSLEASPTPAVASNRPSPAAATSPRSVGPPTPVASTGDASVTMLVNQGTYEFTGGRCLLDDERDALSVQIGLPGGDDYFGVAVSAYPDQLASGVPYRAVLSARWQGTTLPVHDVRVTLDGNFRSGSFAGVEEETSSVSGTFRC